jgi:hypothetical protein
VSGLWLDLDRDALIERFGAHLSGDNRAGLDDAQQQLRQQEQRFNDLDPAITRRDRLRAEESQCSTDLLDARTRARSLLSATVEDDRLVDALESRKNALLEKVGSIDEQRKDRDEVIEAIQAKMEQVLEIARFLRIDASYREASARLGSSDEESSVADRQIEALTRLEGGIRTIAQVLTAKASTQARDTVEGAEISLARMYKVLCNHPYFDDLRIDIKPQLLSGIERNNYVIRSFASTVGRETLASSRLSTAQMNCVALSVYTSFERYRLVWSTHRGVTIGPQDA